MRGLWLAPLVLLGACEKVGQSASSAPSAERGKQVYLASCIACHSADPAKDGPLGPAVKGASRELLEARILHAAYPPGYTPKRPTKLMQAMPQLAPTLGDLEAYLK